MMKSFLILAGAAVMLAQPAYGLFDFGASDDENDALGGFSDLLSGFGDNDVDNDVMDSFGFDFSSLTSSLDAIFENTANWLDNFLGGIDFTEVSNMIDAAVSDASESVQGFANAFEDIFSDINEIPEQFSYFLKDATIDISQMANDIFSEENMASEVPNHFVFR